MSKTERFVALEGVRGVAAVIVVIHHFLLAFFPGYFHGVGSWVAPVQHMRFEDNLYGSPINALLSGPFSVAIFFVLSGFVLSIAFFETRKNTVIKKLAMKRYLRLMLPALASVLFCYALMKLGLSYIPQATAITSSGWLANNWNFAPQLEEALRSGVIGVFTENGNAFNGVLWTMTTEFIGSFMVFAFLLLFAKSSHRWIPYTFLISVTYNSWYLGFVLGMIIADLYASGHLRQVRHNTYLVIGLVIAGIILGGYPTGDIGGTFYAFAKPLTEIEGLHVLTISLTLGATFLIVAVTISSHLTRLFSQKYLSGLGRYTFAVYLTHLPVLFTYGVGMFVLFTNYLTYTEAALAAMIVSIPVVAAVTWLFERYVDAPSISLASYVGAWYRGEASVPYYNGRAIMTRMSAVFVSGKYLLRRGVGFAPAPAQDE